MELDQETLTDISEYLCPLIEFILVVRHMESNTSYVNNIWVPRTDLEPTYLATVVAPGKHPHKIGDVLVVKEHCGTDFTLTIEDEGDIWITALIYEDEVVGECE